MPPGQLDEAAGPNEVLTAVVSDGDSLHMASYDRIDWHLDSAIEAGQPEEHAFTHIGLYLAWLIRHDLHDAGWFPPEHVGAIMSGEMSGSDLADHIDGKLFSGLMSAEGAAFSDARYAAYVNEYIALFDELPEYSIQDGPEAYSKVEPLLDRMYADWIAGGRQASPPKPDPIFMDVTSVPTESTVMIPPGFSQAEIDELLARLPADVNVMTPGSMPPRPHVATELEGLIPADLTSPPMELESLSAKSWKSSILKRALKRLEIAPKDAVVVHGMGGSGQGTLTVMIYAVPGIDAVRLASEFRAVIFRLPGSKWDTRSIGGRDVQWASGEEFTVAFWARDGMVVHVAGQPDAVETAISRLP